MNHQTFSPRPISRAVQGVEPEPVGVGELASGTQLLQAEMEALKSAIVKLNAQLAPVLSVVGPDSNCSDPEPAYRCEVGAALYRQAAMARRLTVHVDDLRARLEV